MSRGFDCLGLESEFGGIGRLERFEKFEPDANQFVRTALGDCHPPFADLFVAGPGENCAGSRRRTLVGILARRIHFRPRRPRLPFVQIVDMRENHFRRRGDAGRPRDAELIWLQRHDDDEENNDGRDGDENDVQYGFGWLLVCQDLIFNQPPAIAPTIRNGSAPFTISSGNGVSGGSSDKSSLQAKNRTNGRRFNVPWSRIVPRKTGWRISSSSSTARIVTGAETASSTSPSTRARLRR